MPYEELVRGPQLTRDFNGENRKSIPAYSFLGIRSQKTGFRDQEVKGVVVGLSLQEGAGSFQIHPIQSPISLVRAWRATQIMDNLRHISGPRTVTDAYEVLGEQPENGSLETTPFQRLATDFGWGMVAQRRKMYQLSFVPFEKMDKVAEYLGSLSFDAVLMAIKSSSPTTRELNRMEAMIVGNSFELDQEELEITRTQLQREPLPA